MIRVLVWYENKPLPQALTREKELYPEGIHGALGRLLSDQADMDVHVATMQEKEFGLADEVLSLTDVLVYYSHKHWREIPDERVDAIRKNVLQGMGIVLLHSSHASKIFSTLLGTNTQCLRWREADERQRVWLVSPSHPIAEGLKGEYFEIPQDETYGEYFEIPQPDEQVFLTVSSGGEVLRSGCCWHRGSGRIFYFASGHETYPVYYQDEIRRIIVNSVRWARSRRRSDWPTWAREAKPLDS